jgi:hypothetical protein
MEANGVAAALVTIVLVAAGVILATVIMNRFSDLLSLVEAPERRAAGA